MMYNQKLAVAVKSNGKILREFKDTVYIPFGSEFSLLIKNLNSVRVIANIHIDGVDAASGGLVLQAGEEMDLERWIKDGNLSAGNKFKFIERTGSIENHRGVKLEDGLIKIEYQFEKPYVAPQLNWDWKYHDTYWYHPPYNPTWPYYRDTTGSPTWTSTTSTHYGVPTGSRGSSLGSSSGMLRGVVTNSVGGGPAIGGGTQSASVNSLSAQSLDSSMKQFGDTTNCYHNDAGITVPGSKSDQKFQTASWFPTETEKNVMILKLLGETPDNKPVRTPVTVKSKVKCVTCGTHNKAHASFCHKCGTALKIYA